VTLSSIRHFGSIGPNWYPKTMRRFLRWVFKVLVLIVVGMVSFLTAMRFAIHGRESSVPNLVGLAPAQAEQLAISKGLLLSREERFYSNEIPVGHVVSQEPPAGTKVRRGWRVRVAESLGPQRVTIPNVIGDSERAAELNLQRRGLDVGSVSTISSPELPKDQIVAQSPPPEAQGVISPKVNLLYNAPAAAEQTFVMPDLVGAKLAEATVAVTDAGLKIGNVRTITMPETPSAQPAPSVPPVAKTAPKTKPVETEALIVAQSPSAGAKVTTGATINFDIVRK
jgi:eukaryotic-like serine/threonine-protein kinase